MRADGIRQTFKKEMPSELHNEERTVDKLV